MDKLCIVDRFEDDYAVIEYGELSFNFPKELLPMHINEGDVLDFHIIVDTDMTIKRSKQIKTKMDQVFKNED
jgi:hypothetical protein